MKVSQKLLEEAVKLHGHLGPFLVLGLRMSLRAKEILGEKPQRAEVETINSKPFLCVVDGIKAIMGNDAVTVREGNSLVAKFSKVNGEEIIIKVKQPIIDKHARVPWERCKEYAYEVMRSKDEDLFE